MSAVGPMGLRSGLACGLMALAALAACKPLPPTITPSTSPTAGRGSPSPLPSAVAEPAAGLAGLADLGFEVFGGSLQVSVTREDGSPIGGAQVRLLGPQVGASTAGPDGAVRFEPLPVATGYRVVAEAAGFAPLQQVGIEIKKGSRPNLTLALRPSATVQGTVTGPQGAVEGAVISDGVAAVLSGPDGKFMMAGANAGTEISVSKTGFEALRLSPNGTALNAVLKANPKVAGFDAAAKPSVPMAKAKAKLVADGWQVLEGPPPAGGVWVLVAPGGGMDATYREKVVAHVAQGGKLMVLAEWAGYGGQAWDSLNALLHELGAHVEPGLLRGQNNEPSFSVARFSAEVPSLAALGACRFQYGAPLFAAPPLLPLARTGDGAYRVQEGTTGVWPVVVGGPVRGGKLVLVGDASAFSDADADGDGNANLEDGANAKLLLSLMAW